MILAQGSSQVDILVHAFIPTRNQWMYSTNQSRERLHSNHQC